MSTNVHAPDKDSGTTDDAQIADGLVADLARSFTVGTDTEGFDHHYFRPADAVVVYDAYGVDHYRYLEGAKLIDWLRHVGNVRGWQSKGPHSDLGIQHDLERKEGL